MGIFFINEMGVCYNSVFLKFSNFLRDTQLTKEYLTPLVTGTTLCTIFE